ncbi:MAG: C40 family peptidase [Spirochaetia bacterium]|nr:C40 family peptidase [Spirochaetia bacterium]
MRRFFSAILLLSAILFSSCETIQIFDYPAKKHALDKGAAKGIAEAAPKSIPKDVKGLTSRQKQLVEAAYWAKGKTSLSVNGKKYRMDCSGVVSAIYMKAGVDLTIDFKKYKGGGVQRIHETLRSKGLVYRPSVPVPGDILFWDNTYDANKNGRADDVLSHIGMVVSSDKRSGEVVYVHHHDKKGIVFEKMNLLHANDPAYNAAMRDSKAKKLPGNKYLASQLYKDAGKGYLLK